MTNPSNAPANKETPANLKDPKNPNPAEAKKDDQACSVSDGNKADACATDKSASGNKPADKKAAA